MNGHITSLGIATLIYHLTMPLVMMVIIGGLAMDNSNEFLGFLGAARGALPIILVVTLITAVPGIISGIGLILRKRRSKLVALISNAVSLLVIPLGTALGVYTFWVLTKDEATAQLDE